MMLEKTIEDYCRAIMKFDAGQGARSSDIACELHLSRNTVAITLRKLTEERYVSMKRYGRARLGAKGRSIARKVNFRHRVLETFLSRELGIPIEDVHEQAHMLEHAAADDMVARLYDYMGRPGKDPHGRRIR